MSANTVSSPAAIDLQSLSNAEFLAAYRASRSGGNAHVTAKVGDRFTVAKSGLAVTCVRVMPRAKSCAFFQDAGGAIHYFRVDRDLVPAPKAPAAPAK